MPHAQRRQRIDDGVDERGRAADVRAFAHALRAHRMVRARRHGVRRLPVRRLERGGHEVVGEVGVQVVALGVVLDLLDERHREAFGQPAVDLPFDDHRVDDDAAIVDGDEAAHLRLARLAIDVHDRHVRAVRVGHVRRVVVVGRFEPRLVLRHVRVGGKRHFLHRHRLGRHALHLELVVGPLDVGLADLEQMRGNLARLLADAARGHHDGGAGDRRAAARVGAEAVGRRVGVAFLDHDVLRIEPQLLGDDLRPGRFVPLALRLGARAHDAGAGRMDADLGAVEHLDAEDVEVLRRPGAHHFGERREADAHQLAARALLRLLLQQRRVADLLERDVERLVIVAAVVGEPQRRRIRELILPDEVLLAQLHGIHAQLVGQDVHAALDRVARFRDAERAAIGDAARRLVREVRVDLGVGDREGVAAGDDAEDARRVLAGIGGRIERAVIGRRRDVQRGDLCRRRSRRSPRPCGSRGRSRCSSGSRCASRST